MTYKQIVRAMEVVHGTTLGVSKRCLRTLGRLGLVAQRGSRSPYQITRAGLHAIGSELPVPRYGEATICVHAERVVDFVMIFELVFGVKVLTQRELVSEDAPTHLLLACKDPFDPNATHRPDFAIEHADGTLVAVKYARNFESRMRLTRNIQAFSRSPIYQQTVYITDAATIDVVPECIRREKAEKVRSIDVFHVLDGRDAGKLPSVFKADEMAERAA